MEKTKKYILFLFILILLALPASQQLSGLFNIRDLDGDFVLSDEPSLTDSTWMDGSFQLNFNNYIEDHIGFRSFIIRLNNTLDFYAYKKSNADGVVVGKNNFLYEYDYIRAVKGEDFIGKRTLGRKLRRLKFLQEYLKDTKGIDILLCFEPSKVRFYPEYLPNKINKEKIENTNYDYLIKLADSLALNHIDLNTYFLTLKGKTPYPLFPKYGTHWSNYGATFGIDTIFKRLEELSGNDYRDIKIDDFMVSTSPQQPDYDIGKASNLLWMLPQENLANPNFSFNNKPKQGGFLVIGDSFYWNIYNMRIQDSLYTGQNFWYFNKLVYPDNYIKPTKVNTLNLKNEVEARDIVLITITERFLRKFAWGFIDQLYQIYGLTSKLEPVVDHENSILSHDLWFESLIDQAKDTTLTLAEMIHNNAAYLLFTNQKTRYLEHFGRLTFESVIREDAIWFDKVKQQSIERNEDFLVTLKLNAEYAFKQKYPQEFEKFMIRNEKIEQLKTDSAFINWDLAKKYYLSQEEALDIFYEKISTK